MKYLLFILTILLIKEPSAAQVTLHGFGGPQLTTAKYLIDEKAQPTFLKPGIFAGLGLKVPFDNQLFFFPAIYYSLKGYKVTFNKPAFPPTIYAVNNNTTIHTIEISPMFQIDVNRKVSHPFIRFGVAVDAAFAGTEKFDSVDVNGTGLMKHTHRPMIFSFGDYGRFSASANVHLGWERRDGYQLFGFYAHGFGSMNNADHGPRIVHRIFGIGIGKKLKTFKE